MLKKIIVRGLFALCGVFSLAAQSNDRLDELLGQAPARLDSACYLLLQAASLVSEDATPAEAFDAAVKAGFLATTRHAEDPVTVQDLSFLLLKTQKLPGGLEWSLLPSPRAAYRELAYRELINTSAGPDRTVAGDEVVRTLGAVRALLGGNP
jgi:hypothetical protein